MSLSSDETYVQTYQKYLKHSKESSDDFRKIISSHTASTKLLKPVVKVVDCKICRVLSKPGDLCKVLNQGLYHKYTSSQDYFYTRDINALISKKRKPFCVRYYDDLVYDECKERMKGYFKKKEAISLMREIKQFYTKFKNFPRNFNMPFFNIINSNIRKHRRLEYIKVFNNGKPEEEKPAPDEQDQPDQKNTSKNEKSLAEFNLMELLGNSFVQENYKDFSGVNLGGAQASNTARSLKEVEENFKALWKVPQNAINDPNSVPFSNALYNKNYMLYSRSDSETAEDILKQIVNEFKDVDGGRKASMTLAEKVLHQVATAASSSKKQENRYSPTVKQRTNGGLEFSSPQNNKKSLGSSNINMTASLQPISRQQSLGTTGNPVPRNTSNLRSNPQLEPESATILGKLSQSKLLDQRKLSTKLSMENLNDIVINRNKILSSLYQFRSTRSKSGGLKSVGPSNKTPITNAHRPSGIAGEQQVESAQTVLYVNEKSPSPSPERKITKEEVDRQRMTAEFAHLNRHIEPSDSTAIKRSASQGITPDPRAAVSPINAYNSQPIHKKASSLIKKRGTPTPMKQTTPIQNFNLHNNSGSVNNMSNSHQETTGSPMNAKFVNLRTTLGGAQPFYFRHQSPMEEKISQVSGVYQGAKSDVAIKNLNIRALKQPPISRIDNNSRAATLSLSGRQQNLSDLSHGLNSFGGSQVSLQVNKTTTDSLKVKKLDKANVQAFAAKIIKRASLTQNLIVPVGHDSSHTEKKGKQVLELSDSHLNGYKDLRLSTKELTPTNHGSLSTASTNKFKLDVKKNTWGPYTLKGSSKDIKIMLKK